MIRVLHIVGRMNRAGQETFIMNLYREVDRKQIQFDFIVHTEEKCDYEDEIIQLGGRIYRATPKSKNMIKNFKDIYGIVKKNKYKIVHRHTNYSVVSTDLLAAMFAGSKIRIAHSHNSIPHKKLLNQLFRPLLNFVSTDKLACSSEAAEQLFGQKQVEKEKVTFIYNSVNLSQFLFNQEIRDDIRKKMGLMNKLVIGHVGRFEKVKNQKRIIDIGMVLKQNNRDIHIILLGEGPEMNNIERYAKEKGIDSNCSFLGCIDNVNHVLMVFDILLFPSFFEGLPVALVEAQASGLPILASDVLPKEALLIEQLKMLSLEEDNQKWCHNLLELVGFYANYNRQLSNTIISKTNFNIDNSKKDITDIYLKTLI